jgi:lipopolysaccharide export system permease protein
MILNAGGISIYSLLKPVLVISMGVGLLLFFLAETVTPPTILKANEIDAREIRKTEGASLKRENIWFKGERQITHIAFFHPSGRTAFGYTRYHFDNAFQLIRRVDAKRLELVDGQWILYDGMQQTMNKDTGDLRVEVFTQQKEELNLKPSQFRKMAHRPEEMSMHRLAEYIERVEREGYDAQAYRVDLIHKTAYPFTGLVMGIIGMGLTARKKPVQGLPMAVSIGIAIAFLYWVFQGVCLSLGYGGVLPAAIAAWGANLVFLGGGTLLLINAE